MIGIVPRSDVAQKALRGVYLILDNAWAHKRSLEDLLKCAAECGLTLFQYRNKTSPMREVYREAHRLRKIAADAEVLFIVNDRCDVALAVGADGVHLGQKDLPLDLARCIMGPEVIIGISTHITEEVKKASEGGADYIGFGPIFQTRTKIKHEKLVGIGGIKEIRPLTSLPVFAIGGITPETMGSCISAGANGVAVASGILDAPDIEKTIQRFTMLLSLASLQAD